MTRGRVRPGKRGAAAEPAAAKFPAKEVHRLTDLDQMKVLADPLRIRILELFCQERTTKQVAGILEQPPTRLYHHVSALERVGLIRLMRTQQRRGAVEKYYLAVARTFSADATLFSSSVEAQVKGATRGVAAQILENTIADLRALIESGGEGLEAMKHVGVLSYLEVRARPKELKAIRDKLMKVVKISSRAEPKASEGLSAYRLTIAFFPLAKGRHST